MDPDQQAASLALLALPGVGPRSLSSLLRLAGSAQGVLGLDGSALEASGLRPEALSALAALRGHPSDAAYRQRDWLLANGVLMLPVDDAAYPALLREIDSAPPFLFVRGAAAALAGPQVAVVGSRSPTPAGREIAAELAAGLCKYGLTVTSGLARGVDGAAHQGLLAAGGLGVAVMGTGPDRVYPTSHRSLAARLVEAGGALVTEFAPGVPPEPSNFPRRNRIISGLALGVVIVEAALASGSLVTARHAVAQNREVMAVPGPVREPTSRGCHALLRDGAALIECAEDVLRALGDRFKPHPGVPPAGEGPEATSGEAGEPPLDPVDARVLRATGYEHTSLDRVVERTGLSAAQVGAALVRLELAGRVASVAGAVQRLR